MCETFALTSAKNAFVDYIPWSVSRASLILWFMRDKKFNHLLGQLGADIKSLRTQAGLSQEALALAAEVDRTYVSQLERGIANPSLLILYRVSAVLEASLDIRFLQIPSPRK
jgi:DNA-binding XRE family transcriptional regulator